MENIGATTNHNQEPIVTVPPKKEPLPLSEDYLAYFRLTVVWPILGSFARAWELSDEKIGNMGMDEVAMEFLNRGHPNILISNLGRFKGLSKEVAEALVNAGYRHDSVYDTSFDGKALVYLKTISGQRLVGRGALRRPEKGFVPK